MRIFKGAFTILEFIFVIVIIGILSSVAIPKFTSLKTNTEIVKGRSDVSSIRSSIITERQTRLIRGESNFINRLDSGVPADREGEKIFDSNETLSATSPTLLKYPIITKNGDGHWMKSADTNYTYTIKGDNITFTYYPSDTTSGIFYRAGSFDCDHSDAICKKLTE